MSRSTRRLPESLAKRRSYRNQSLLGRRGEMLLLLANGLSQREVNTAVGNKHGAHWAAWNLVRRLKLELAAGKTPDAIAESLEIPSDDRRGRVVEFLKQLAAKVGG